MSVQNFFWICKYEYTHTHTHKQIGIVRCSLEDNIKIGLTETGCEMD
jgi:hypothetical protein